MWSDWKFRLTRGCRVIDRPNGAAGGELAALSERSAIKGEKVAVPQPLQSTPTKSPVVIGTGAHSRQCHAGFGLSCTYRIKSGGVLDESMGVRLDPSFSKVWKNLGFSPINFL